MVSFTRPVFPDDVKSKLGSQLHLDPQVPSARPTMPTWQLPPHPLANIQSESLAADTEFAIIGSGATGCSVAKNLLENALSGNSTVTVLEVRTLTSGATSRKTGPELGE